MDGGGVNTVKKSGKLYICQGRSLTSAMISHVDTMAWEGNITYVVSPPETHGPANIIIGKTSDKSKLSNIIQNTWPVLLKLSGHKK